MIPRHILQLENQELQACSRCVIPGPDILPLKRKDDPSTYSPTRKPRTASMLTLPCVNSASRYRLMVAASASAAKPRGSKNPTGGRTPGSFSGVLNISTGLGISTGSAAASIVSPTIASPTTSELAFSATLVRDECVNAEQP